MAFAAYWTRALAGVLEGSVWLCLLCQKSLHTSVFHLRGQAVGQEEDMNRELAVPCCHFENARLDVSSWLACLRSLEGEVEVEQVEQVEPTQGHVGLGLVLKAKRVEPVGLGEALAACWTLQDSASEFGLRFGILMGDCSDFWKGPWS